MIILGPPFGSSRTAWSKLAQLTVKWSAMQNYNLNSEFEFLHINPVNYGSGLNESLTVSTH
jgi:hypothetical protein